MCVHNFTNRERESARSDEISSRRCHNSKRLVTELIIVRESCAKPSGTADSGRWLEVDRVQKETERKKRVRVELENSWTMRSGSKLCE